MPSSFSTPRPDTTIARRSLFFPSWLGNSLPSKCATSGTIGWKFCLTLAAINSCNSLRASIIVERDKVSWLTSTPAAARAGITIIIAFRVDVCVLYRAELKAGSSMTQRFGSGSYGEPSGGRDTSIILLLCSFDEVSSSSVAEDSPSLTVESVKLDSLGEQGSDAAV